MKKKIKLLAIALSLIANSLSSQSILLENVTRQGFKGLRKMNDDGYYVQCIESTKGKGKNAKNLLHLYALNNDLKVTTDFTIELSTTEKVEDVAFNNDRFMIISSSVAEKKRTFKIVDKAGIEMAKKDFEKVNARLFAKPAVIIPTESDFLVINYVREKKVGYSVERFNSGLEEVFSKIVIPEKKKLYPVDYAISGDKLYVLEYHDADMNDTFEYTIASYNISNGEGTEPISLVSSDSKAYGFATFIKPAKEGGVVTGGMYFNGPRTQESNSDGFFAAVIRPDKSLQFSYVDWKDATAKLKDQSTAAFWGGKTKTFMHDLTVNSNGSITLIGENYRRGDADLAGGKSKSALGLASKVGKVTGQVDDDGEIALTASEFTLMDFDANGNFIGIRKVDKPNAVTIVKNTTDPNDPPFVGQRKGLNLANILNNNGFMPYRFVAQGNTPYLVYWQRYDPIIKELVYFTPINAEKMDTTSVEVTGSELRLAQEMQNKLLGKMGGFGKLVKKTGEVTGSSYENTFELRGSHDPFDYRGKDLNSRIIPANVSGKVVIYDFEPQLDEDEKKSFSTKMMETAAGNLKIWYIDLPSR